MPFGDEGVQPGIGIAVSGGGFRATLFHLGSFWRLNELGFLETLDRISSVSGGSITSGVLACAWPRLAFQAQVATRFVDLVVDPVRKFCSLDIDSPAIAEGAFRPFYTVSDSIAESYANNLFGAATLQDLPETPRFIFNATNFQTGVSFRFSKPYAGDYRIGLIRNPTISLAKAVTASSAFPPVLSPVVIDASTLVFDPVAGSDLCGNPAYCKNLCLTDGGVYDNLGLETVWNRLNTILVSDAGAPLGLQDRVSSSWEKQAMRAMDIATDQARALRKRALIGDFKSGKRTGTYWGITTKMADYNLGDSLTCQAARVESLAKTRTRLNTFSEQEQCELINWGYALCDAAMRRHVLPGQSVHAPQWPYTRFGLDRP